MALTVTAPLVLPPAMTSGFGVTVRLAVSKPLKSIVMSPAGVLPSVTLTICSVSPSSATVNAVGSIVTEAVSSSTMVTSRLAGAATVVVALASVALLGFSSVNAKFSSLSSRPSAVIATVWVAMVSPSASKPLPSLSV